jgi:hypothetical protein
MPESNTQTVAARTIPAAKSLIPIHPERFGLETERHNRWSITLEHKRPVEEILDAGFLSHVARMLRAGDTVIVRKEDSTYYAELYVHDASNTHVRTELIFEAKLSAVTPQSVGVKGYKIAHGGLQDKWRVIRESDDKVVKSGFANETDAVVWLQGFAKTIAA